MKELYRFRQFLTEGVIKENISSHKEEAKRFLEKFVDDNEDKFEFIPDLETGYIDANDNSYNVDELASIFLDIGQDIPRGTHNQKYKGEGGTYVVVSEGVIKEEVSSRFIKKYLSMVKPENFKDIEDIESYSDRDKAIFLYLEIGPGIMISDELARDLKDKPSEEIVQYFKDRNYSYMPYSAMDKIFGSITPIGMEFERGAPEKVHLDRTHNMRINKILRNKYSDVIDFMKSDRTGGNAIEVHNAIQDRYSDEAKDGRSREVSYEEYASDFADAIRDRM